MAIDAACLHDLAINHEPLLRFYEWEGPSATFGHFLDPYKCLRKDTLLELGIELAKRPTGGGIVLHINDFTYSVLIPSNFPHFSKNTLENYAFVHKIVMKALSQFLNCEDNALSLLKENPHSLHPQAAHFCMAGPVRYDVMFLGKKIGGGAQRRNKHGVLHQGTISMGSPEEFFLKDLFVAPEIKDLIVREAASLKLDQRFKELLIDAFRNCSP